MTYKELKLVQGALAKIMGSTKLEAGVAFRASKFARRMIAALNELEEKRVEVAKRYAGDLPEVPKEKEDEFQREMASILAEDADLPPIRFTLRELENVGLSAFDFAALGDIIEE